MKRLNKLKITFQPIYHTIYLNSILQIKKFVIFALINILLLIIANFIFYALGLASFLPYSLATFYVNGSQPLILLIVLEVCFFFSGILCSEFNNKTGLTIMPLISKNKLLLGKYIANLLLVIGLIGVHYMTIAFFGYYLYGGVIISNILISFGFAVLFFLALSSIVTFFSSFMKSVVPIIIIIIGLFFFGFSIIEAFMRTIAPEFEPLYSLLYMSNIILYSLYPNFTSMDRVTLFGQWIFPTVEGALIMMSIFTVIFFTLANQLFKRRGF